MSATDSDLWLVRQLARRSLGVGSLRGFWRDLDAHRASRSPVTTCAAAVLWVALLPLVRLAASRRRRLVNRALEGAVRAIVAGVDRATATDRAVDWLAHRGLDPVQARADVERLLAGFVAPAAARPERRRRRVTSAG